MPYEHDPDVLAWFERSLSDERHMVRRRAVELLEHVDCAMRMRWLARAEADENARVAATAVLVGAILDYESHAALFDLMESDFFDGREAGDLEWEWEWAIKVCDGPSVPAVFVLVWTKQEDDQAARRIALLKMFPGEDPALDAMPVTVGKRVVTRFTRSPRSHIEAALWHRDGRPRYQE
jgi:hypothetical protein